MTIEEIKEYLCHYDGRHPDYFLNIWEDKREPRINCYCDNCFYGRDSLAVMLLELLDKGEK